MLDARCGLWSHLEDMRRGWTVVLGAVVWLGCAPAGGTDRIGPVERVDGPDGFVNRIVAADDGVWAWVLIGDEHRIYRGGPDGDSWEEVLLETPRPAIAVLRTMRGRAFAITTTSAGLDAWELGPTPRRRGAVPNQLSTGADLCMDGSGRMLGILRGAMQRFVPGEGDGESVGEDWVYGTSISCAELADGSILAERRDGLVLIPDGGTPTIVRPCGEAPLTCLTDLGMGPERADGSVDLTDSETLWRWSRDEPELARLSSFGDRTIVGPAPYFYTAIWTSIVDVDGLLLATQRTDYGGGNGVLFVHEGADVWRILRSDLPPTVQIGLVTPRHVWLTDGGGGALLRMARR